MKYFANQDDIQAIIDGLKYIWHPKLEYIFQDKNRISKTLAVSYDSQNIFLFSVKPPKLVRKIKHNLKIKDCWRSGWCAGLYDEKIKKLLLQKIVKSKEFKYPLISGGLLTPFIKFQKKKGLLENPYVTKESYQATIVHELGHVYWNSYKLWWPSDKKQNISLIKNVEKLYKQNQKMVKFDLSFPLPFAFGELFAFCVEYSASKIFWRTHKKNLDRLITKQLKMFVKEEKKRDLDVQDSIIDFCRNPHNFSFVYGKVILNKYPKTWPQILTRKYII